MNEPNGEIDTAAVAAFKEMASLLLRLRRWKDGFKAVSPLKRGGFWNVQKKLKKMLTIEGQTIRSRATSAEASRYLEVR